MAIKRDYKKSQLNQNFVAKNTKFRFRCTECGECCRNVEKEDKILLSAVDIYRAAKYLNLEVQTFIGMHCELVPGGESMLHFSEKGKMHDSRCKADSVLGVSSGQNAVSQRCDAGARFSLLSGGF